jgi:hypothetical protein
MEYIEPLPWIKENGSIYSMEMFYRTASIEKNQAEENRTGSIEADFHGNASMEGKPYGGHNEETPFLFAQEKNLNHERKLLQFI